jgi:hypothetical protein
MFMTPNQLYKHIETIYNHFEDFKSKMLIDNLLIIKRDNYYQGFISVTDNLKLQFKIAFEDGTNHRTDDKTYYRLQYEIVNGLTTEKYEITESPEFNSKILCSDKFMTEIPQSFLNLFNPTLREFKIKMVMNNKEDSTQTIFEHSI